MANEEGTALHLLARQETTKFRNSPLPSKQENHPLYKGNLTFSFLKIKTFLRYTVTDRNCLVMCSCLPSGRVVNTVTRSLNLMFTFCRKIWGIKVEPAGKEAVG